MKTFIFIVHIINGIMLSVYGVVSVLMSFFGTLLSALASLGAYWPLSLVVSLLALIIGIMCFVWGSQDRYKIKNDIRLYQKRELILDIGTTVVWLLEAILLIVCHYSLARVIEHGFGKEMIFFLVMSLLNAFTIFITLLITKKTD